MTTPFELLIEKKNREINELKTFVAEQRKQLLSEKKKCEWFYMEGVSDTQYACDLPGKEEFEDTWDLWISSMPTDIEKRRSMKK